MTSRKRARATDLQIKVAVGESVSGSISLVRNFSTVYDDIAQPGCQEWDVSGFLLDGKPFERTAVKCWLDCAYTVLHGKAELDAEDLE